MRGILFDLDGVLYQADEAIPGALRTLEWVNAMGIPHCFVTNTTSKPRSAIRTKLAAMGIGVEVEQIISPPLAASRWLRAHTQGPVALFVPEATRAEFSGLPLWNEDEGQAVDAVVVGDLAGEWSFTRLNQAFRCLMGDPAPALVALGMTRYWRTAQGLQLDAGPFVMALQYATGIEPRVLGKPATDFFQVAADCLGLARNELLMIGDDIRGDVQGAQQAGLRAVLVRTGKFQAADLQGEVRPDAVLESVAELPAWWERENPG
jgi:HAD superfamily hydrolase (TIGR01458 family)